jgi:hypothetical protein
MATSSPPARADETRECVDAHYKAQELRNARKLIEARSRFVRCSATSCPRLVQKECADLLAEVQRSLPSVVFAAKDEAGIDLLDVAVSVDGQPMSERIDGSAVAIDPGPHTVGFRRPGGQPVEQVILVNEGEKDRIVRAVISGASPVFGPAPATVVSRPSAPAEAPSAPRETSSRSWAPVLISGGVSALAIASFAYFGLNGQASKDELSATCRSGGACSSNDVDRARTQLIIADVSLVVGLVSAGAALYFLLQKPAPVAATAR